MKGNLPIYNNIHLDYSILFTRKLHLTVGKSQDIYNVSTLLGVGNNFLKHFEGDSFFTKIDFFLTVDDYLLSIKNSNTFILTPTERVRCKSGE